jgi:hypothetical protein
MSILDKIKKNSTIKDTAIINNTGGVVTLFKTINQQLKGYYELFKITRQYRHKRTAQTTPLCWV